MDLTVVIEDFLHSAAITNPVEHGAPKVLLVLGDTPATTSGFADEGVEVTLLFGAFAGVKADRPQSSAFESQIEIADAVLDEALSCGK